jgi:hypothetical protein
MPLTLLSIKIVALCYHATRRVFSVALTIKKQRLLNVTTCDTATPNLLLAFLTDDMLLTG